MPVSIFVPMPTSCKIVVTRDQCAIRIICINKWHSYKINNLYDDFKTQVSKSKSPALFNCYFSVLCLYEQ